MEAALGQLDVRVVAPTFEAGTLATVDLIIRNPFDKPIAITTLKTPSSTALRKKQIGVQQIQGMPAAIVSDTPSLN